MVGSGIARNAVVVLAVAGGIALRWVHLGTPSLWWDEIVHIAMAQGDTVADVVRVVRHGVPPGKGNAGAMPLDYLLLHAWLALTGVPAPAHLEVHFRVPAFVWSVAGLIAFAAFARRRLDRDVGLVAVLLFASSIPHVLYAAEARSYALLVALNVGHLWAFARLLEAPAAGGRWIAWFLLAAASVLTGVLSAVPLAAELCVVLVWPRRSLAALVASAVALALLVAWLAAPSFGVIYTRPPGARPGLVATAWQVASFLAWHQPVLLAAFAAGLALAWWDRDRRGLVAALVLSLAAVPLVTGAAEWKSYYVHPRHVIFLLPAFVILTAFGIVHAVRGVVGARWGVVVAAALVAAIQLPVVRRYVAEPQVFFLRTKHPQDVRAVAASLAGLPAGTRWLVLAERQAMPNAVLDQYLRWYGLADRVVLRSAPDVPAALRLLADPQVPAAQLAAKPVAALAVGVVSPLRRFLGIATDTVPAGRLDGVTIVAWKAPAPIPTTGLVRRRLPGAWLFDRAPAPGQPAGASRSSCPTCSAENFAHRFPG